MTMNGTIELRVDTEASLRGEQTAGFVLVGARDIGLEMVAEGWQSIGRSHDYVWWSHFRGSRSISVTSYPWKNVHGIPALRGAPTDPNTPGFVVACRIHDELGNPGEGSSFWVESFDEAMRWARRIRTEILGEYPPPATGQLTFEALLPPPAG